MAKVAGLPAWDADTEAEFVKVLPGGSGLNQGRHLHGLGIEVRFLGALGDDSFGDMMFRHVKRQAFPTEHIKVFKGLPSSVCVVLAGPADRAFVSCYSTTDAFSIGDLRERAGAVEGCAHLHVGGYFNLKGLQNPELTQMVRQWRVKGITVSLNTQYDAAEIWTGQGGHLAEFLHHVDFLFVNIAEAERIAGALLPARGPGRGGEGQRLGDPQGLCSAYPNLTVLMTRGHDGCDILRAGRPPIHVPTKPVDKVVDATGAGDAFIAGFLSKWLTGGQARGAADQEALLRAAGVRGHAVARVCVGREGACVEPVRLDDLEPGV